MAHSGLTFTSSQIGRLYLFNREEQAMAEVNKMVFVGLHAAAEQRSSKALIWMVALLVGLVSCHYNVEEDLVPINDCDVSKVSYALHISPIIESRCLQCHAASLNFGGITLEGYDQLKKQIDGGRFLGAINHEPGFSPMPQNEGQLPTCNLDMIQAWINEGAPNN